MIRDVMMVRLTGLRVREKDRSRIPREELVRLDVLDSAAKGLDQNDPARSVALAARYCRIALKTGDPGRAALGLTRAIFGFLSFRLSRPAIIDEILDQVEAIGEQLSDPTLLGAARVMCGMSHYAFGSFRVGARMFNQAAAIFAERCIGMAYEQRTARLTAALCHLRLGDLEEARRIGEALLLDAVERGDPMAEKNVCAGVLAPLSLAVDEPTRARDLVARAKLEDRCVSVLLRARLDAAVALYEDRPREAVQAWRRSWQRIEDMHVLDVPALRVFTVRSLGLALLAGLEGRRERREAVRLMRSIRRYKFAYARAAYAHLRACLAMRDERPERAEALLAQAAEQYEEAGMILDATACRYRRGQIAAGDEGGAETAAAGEKLRARGILRPERWVVTLVPEIPIRRLTA